MKSLNLEQMEGLGGGALSKGEKYFYTGCGLLASTVKFSIVNPVWAAFHISAVAGCGLVGALDVLQ